MSAVEPITWARGVEVFQHLASLAHIAFHYRRDGCFARAHLMVRELLAQGLSPRKVWTFASGPTDLLWVHPTGQAERIEWDYHVAPVLSVRTEDGEVCDLVFDPSLFDRPVTIEVWRDIQHDTPEVKQTALGEPPLPELGGSGYWPGPDPPAGPDIDAEETMADYLGSS